MKMRAALADARSVDEVKDIRDKAEAMRAYARMANDTQLEMDSAELRLRAERRLSIMLTEHKQTIGMNRGARGIGTSAVPRENRTPTLADVGIDKKLSARSQKVGGIGGRSPAAPGRGAQRPGHDGAHRRAESTEPTPPARI
jgi:hypothetical protein